MGASSPRARRRRAWLFGRWSEMACAVMLRLKGYRILARRLRTPVGEIDILARRGRVLAVVEVKARPNRRDARFAIGDRQRRRIVSAADWFLASRPDCADLEIRFDAMLVAPWKLPEHLEDAWRSDD
ncbi:MAG: YraN family protein [Alphaproteobacteria bacterium]|nr:YraN family protein [Alphaproteobacteria bacterium]